MALDSRIVIHANAKVIEMIEKAKYLSDRLIDGLPGVFAVVRQDGAIVRSNLILASLLGLKEDQTREVSILTLFQEAESDHLLGIIKNLGQPPRDAAQFEVLLKNGKSYRFHFSRYGEALGEPLVTVLGTDVTELRERERQFAELYNYLPFGIVGVDLTGRVTQNFSVHTVWLLGREPRVGELMADFLVSRSLSRPSPAQSVALTALFSGTPFSRDEFTELVHQLPSEYRVKLDSGVLRYLSCRYIPILAQGLVERVLVVLADAGV